MCNQSQEELAACLLSWRALAVILILRLIRYFRWREQSVRFQIAGGNAHGLEGQVGAVGYIEQAV